MEIVEFSWLPALAGGIMIGTASALLMAFNGRVAGISGILGGLLSRWSPDQWWRLTFLLGLVLGGGVAFYWAPEAFIDITENGTMQVWVQDCWSDWEPASALVARADMESAALAGSLSGHWLRPLSL